MKVNSEQISDTLSGVISSLINGSFDVAHKNTTMQELTVSALHETIDGVSDAIDFGADNGNSNGNMALSDIKSGIYSIVYAGLSSGLEGVDSSDGNNVSAVLNATKEAVFSKTKEVLPGLLCDRIQSEVFSTFEKRRVAAEDNGHKNATIFIDGAAEVFANHGIDNLRSFLSGEVTAAEAAETSVIGAATQIKDQAVEGIISSAIDKLGVRDYIDADEFLLDAKRVIDGETAVSDVAKGKAFSVLQSRVSRALSNRRDAIEDKSYLSGNRKDGALFVQDSVETFANRGMQELHEVLSGNKTLSEAIDGTVSDATKEISDKAINGAINKACDKLGITKYLDPETLLGSAQNVKDCFIEYINGEITETQFFLKVGQDGLYQVAQAWGTSIGTSIVVSTGMHGIAAAVTAAASSTIITAVYSELYKYALNVFEEEVASEQRLKAIRALSAEAVDVIREEREFLLNSTFIQAEKRQRVFNESLNSLAVALDTNDIDLLTKALNQITAEVGGTIQFKTFEEFDEFMLDDSLALEF